MSTPPHYDTRALSASQLPAPHCADTVPHYFKKMSPREKSNIRPKASVWITRRASPLRLASRDQVLSRQSFFQGTTTARTEWSLVGGTFRVLDPFRVVHGGMMPVHPSFLVSTCLYACHLCARDLIVGNAFTDFKDC